MKILPTLLFPICLGICGFAIYLMFDFYDYKELKTYFLLSNIGLLWSTLYYLDATSAYLGIFSFLGDMDRNYKISFCYNFMITVLYWSIRLFDASYLKDGSSTKPDHIVIFLHGGLLVLNILEYFIWRTHYQTVGQEYLYFFVMGLILTSLIYVPWFWKEYAVYPFVKRFQPVEFALFPIMLILLLFLGERLHFLITSINKKENNDKLIIEI